MATTEGKSSGLFSAVRRVVGTGVAALKNRLELLGVELQEEKLRLLGLLLWTAGAIFFGVMGLVIFTITLLFLFDEPNRVYALGGLTVFFLLGAGLAIRTAKQRLQKRARPFSRTVAEVKKAKERFKLHSAPANGVK